MLSSPNRQASVGSARPRAATPPPGPKGAGPQASVDRSLNAQKPTADAATRAVRAGFIRKVYGIISAQLTLTIVVSATITLNDNLRSQLLTFVIAWPIVFKWGLLGATMGMLFLLRAKKNEVPTNYYLLTGFTLLNAVNLTVALSTVHEFLHEEGDDMILHAAGITLAIFLGLTLFTFKSDRDFSFMGAFLHMAVWGMIVAGVVSWAFGIHGLDAFTSWFGAMIFSGYIVYDTWKLSSKYGPDDYIVASIELYMDLINLFLHVLNILLKQQQNKDKKKEKK